jgi:type IV pilus assembly protein PilB
MSAASQPRQAPDPRHARRDVQLGELLRRRGVLTEEQLQSALALQRAKHPDRRLGTILVEQGYASERDVVAARAASVGLPFATITPRLVNPDALRLLPGEFCERRNVLPLAHADGWLTVAVEDFTDLHLVEEIKRQSNLQVQIVAATGDNIRQIRTALTGAAAAGDPKAAAKEASAKDGAAAGSIQSELDELLILSTENRQEEKTQDLQTAAAGSPIVKLVNHMIKTAVEARASDIHIEPEEDEFRIRYRIDGDLVPEQFRPSIHLLPAVVSRIKIISGMDISERRLPQDGVVSIMLANRPVELRVSTMATPMGEKVVMRLVDGNRRTGNLDELGFMPGLINEFRAAIREPHGMVLVTGPTGSGKTTTLYSALSEIISQTVNISTVEDPVERKLKGVNQFQVHPKAGFTFAKALRSLLRQDPDVIMVCEIRDAETAKLATEAALTGHLVLSTLHTNDAPSAVPRLVNMGVEPYLVAASLRAVLSQRLVGRLCVHCRQQTGVTPAARAAWTKLSGRPCQVDSIYQGVGCARCRHTGYSGRVAVHELLLLREETFEALGGELDPRGMRQIAKVSPFRPLAHDCLEKIAQGLISIEALFELTSPLDSTDTPRPAVLPSAA